MNDQPQLPGIRTARDIIAEMDRPARANFKNDGKAFEAELERTNLGYARIGVASLQKVDPPVRILGGGQSTRKVIFLRNWFLDWVGVWSAHHGRALFVEAKSTAEGRLRFNVDGGFSRDQWTAMKRWRTAGAACCLLWKYGQLVRLFTPEALLAQEEAAAKSIYHEDGIPVPRGMRDLIHDFLPVLEGEIWGPKKG